MISASWQPLRTHDAGVSCPHSAAGWLAGRCCGSSTRRPARAARCPCFLMPPAQSPLRHLRPGSEKFAASGYYVEIDSTLPAQKVAQALLAILYFGAGVAMMTAPAILWILK